MGICSPGGKLKPGVQQETSFFMQSVIALLSLNTSLNPEVKYEEDIDINISKHEYET